MNSPLGLDSVATTASATKSRWRLSVKGEVKEKRRMILRAEGEQKTFFFLEGKLPADERKGNPVFNPLQKHQEVSCSGQRKIAR